MTDPEFFALIEASPELQERIACFLASFPQREHERVRVGLFVILLSLCKEQLEHERRRYEGEFQTP